MERSQQALGRAQFRAKGKWYLAQEVDLTTHRPHPPAPPNQPDL